MGSIRWCMRFERAPSACPGCRGMKTRASGGTCACVRATRVCVPRTPLQTRGEPVEALQLRAGFDATGAVYQSPDDPEAVYVRMTTGWFENTFVRFVSDALGDGGHVYYKGRYYQCDAGYEMTKRFPAAYMYVGSLQTIEADFFPQNDLETNAANLFGERKVFADPNDSRYLLVSVQIIAANDAYRVCRYCDER